MSSGGSAKRRGPAPFPASHPSKRSHPNSGAANGHESPQLPPQRSAGVEDEMMDEDVFLEETLLKYEEDEEALMLLQHEVLLARLAKWRRPPLSQSYLSCSQSVIFQQLDIDYVIGESHKELLPNSSGPAAILRMFGVTREGHSVCCHVHGFEPYFYISCPQGMGPDDVSRFHQVLEGRMREANRSGNVPKFVKRIDMVQRKSIMYYQQQQSHLFLKIIVTLPTMVATCRGKT